MSSVLVIGSGGREHALGWKLAQSPHVQKIIVAPGNDGYPAQWEHWPCSLSAGKIEFIRLAKRAREEKVDLVVIGPDQPLADGIVDIFEVVGVPCFGPSQKAAQLEASKSFAKDVMRAAGIPTARFQVVRGFEEARNYIQTLAWTLGDSSLGWVIKADGLALGKGVRVCKDFEEAIQTAEELSKISQILVIEERLEGQELSWMAFSDGERCALLEPARDYKPLLDGNRGPNTGGMGAFSPVSGVPKDFSEKVRKRIFEPVIAEMARRQNPFRGLLYAGLMVDAAYEKFWVLEFNARFGDPEAQVLLPRMQDDLFLWCHAVARGDLSQLPESVPFRSESAVIVIGAAPGYPGPTKKGLPLEGSFEHCFVAGVRYDAQKKWITDGGRVFGALGIGPHLRDARQEAYKYLEANHFPGMQYRKDIAEGT